MTALHQFGAEMFKLSRGLETVGSDISSTLSHNATPQIVTSTATSNGTNCIVTSNHQNHVTYGDTPAVMMVVNNHHNVVGMMRDNNQR